MPIADVGAAALWMAVIAVGIAVVVIVQTRAHHGLHWRGHLRDRFRDK
jgi:hypothetical protein